LLSQLAAPSSVQSSFGSVLFSVGPQVPLPVPLCFKETLHDWHAAVQAVAQQTPSTQNPLAQSVGVLQKKPLVLRQVELAV
jgi:hypothetical protein